MLQLYAGGHQRRHPRQQRFRRGEVFFGGEIDPIRVRLENHSALRRERINESLQEFAALARDLRRQFTVAEPRPGKAEVAIK